MIGRSGGSLGLGLNRGAYDFGFSRRLTLLCGRRLLTLNCLFSYFPLTQTLQVFDPPGVNRGADQFVLTRKALGQDVLVETAGDQIVVGRTLAGQDLATGVNQ